MFGDIQKTCIKWNSMETKISCTNVKMNTKLSGPCNCVSVSVKSFLKSCACSTMCITYLLNWVNIFFHKCLHLFIQPLSFWWWLEDVTIYRWIQISKKAFPKIITAKWVNATACHTVNKLTFLLRRDIKLWAWRRKGQCLEKNEFIFYHRISQMPRFV